MRYKHSKLKLFLLKESERERERTTLKSSHVNLQFIQLFTRQFVTLQADKGENSGVLELPKAWEISNEETQNVVDGGVWQMVKDMPLKEEILPPAH